MIEGIYTAAASLSTLEKWQASISQNLASSSVAGFKKSNFAVETDEKLKRSPVEIQHKFRHSLAFAGLRARESRLACHG